MTQGLCARMRHLWEDERVRRQCPPAGVPRAVHAPQSALSVSPQSLASAFATVPDQRRAGSETYPLAAMLTLAVAALLANHLSVLAIAEWGKRHSPYLLTRLGFPPCQSTLQRLFCEVDGHALAATLATRPNGDRRAIQTVEPGHGRAGSAAFGRLDRPDRRHGLARCGAGRSD